MSKSGKRPHGTAGPLLHVPVVFVHGLKCAYLLDESTGKYAWFTPQMLIRNKRFGDLGLPTTRDENGSQHMDSLRPVKVVRRVKIGPRTYPVYGPCLDELERQGRQVHEFSYDWRRDLFESTDKLLEFVEKVYNVHKVKATLSPFRTGRNHPILNNYRFNLMRAFTAQLCFKELCPTLELISPLHLKLMLPSLFSCATPCLCR